MSTQFPKLDLGFLLSWLLGSLIQKFLESYNGPMPPTFYWQIKKMKGRVVVDEWQL
jgi:hypothetical protein